MGYSTMKIDLKRAKEMLRKFKMEATEASEIALFDRKALRHAVSASISDHEPPRLYFDFKDGSFVCYEVNAPKPSECEIVVNKPLVPFFPTQG